MRKNLCVLASLLLLCVCNGCSQGGPKVNMVEGTVLFDGQPLSNASVFFHPNVAETGLPAVGITNTEGKFKLTSLRGGPVNKGAMLGEYTITVTRLKDEPIRPPKGDEAPEYESFIPEKYNVVKTSGMTATIGSGKNEIKLELQSK